MNTILNICEAFKGFVNYIVSNNQLRDGYVDVFVLIGIACITAIALTLIERRS